MFTRVATLVERAVGSRQVPMTAEDHSSVGSSNYPEPTGSKSHQQETDGSKRHPTEKMKAVIWHGKRHVEVEEIPRPLVTDDKDCIIKVTGTTICGSDLHLYHAEIPDMRMCVLGHEAMGVVIEVGPQVKDIKVGDRVVSPFSISCGTCWYCEHSLPSMCSETNKSSLQQALWGDRIGAVLGYSHFLGGIDGAQAEYMRIPFADANAFVLSPKLEDERALFLSDIACTSYNACRVVGMLEEHRKEENKQATVGIWGAGPIGLCVAQWCIKLFKVKKVFLIDAVPNRLEFAKKIMPEVEVVDRNKVHNVAEYLHKNTEHDLGVDIAFDCGAFRYEQSMLHKAMRAMALETDTPETLNEIIKALRKFGRCSIPADYAGLANGFNIGGLMEKGLTFAGTGQAPARALMPEVQEHMIQGHFDPTLLLTHRFKIDEFKQLYKAYDEKVFDEHNGVGLLKCFVETSFSNPRKLGPELSKVPGA